MKRATFSSFDVSRIIGLGKKRPRSETMREIPPPPAIFAPFLNTRDDIRRAGGPGLREYLIPIAVEPRSSTTVNKVNFRSRTRSEDRSGQRTSETQRRASRTSGRMSTNSSGMGTNVSSNMASHVPAESGETQCTNFSVSVRKSNSEPLADTSKDTDLHGRSDQSYRRGGTGSMLLPLSVCILALIVMAVLVPFVFSTPSRSPQHLYADTRQATEFPESTTLSKMPPGHPRPAAGHLGAPCSDSSSCLGEALCMNGACRCEGPDLRVVKGTCVAASTTVMEEPPLSRKPTTTSRRSSTKTRAQVTASPKTRPEVTVSVRMRTETLGNGTETEPATFEEDSGLSTTVVNGTVREEDGSRGTESWNATADWHSIILTSAHWHSSTETLHPFAGTVRLDASNTSNANETEPASFEEDSGLNTTVVNGTVLEEEGSRGTESWNSTADWSSSTENSQPAAGDIRLNTYPTLNDTETEPATFEESGWNTTVVNGTVLEEEGSHGTEGWSSTDDWTSSTETLQPVAGNTSLDASSTWNATDTEPATSEAESSWNTTVVNGTFFFEEGSAGTEGSNSTDDLSEADVQERQRQPEEASVMDF